MLPWKLKPTTYFCLYLFLLQERLHAATQSLKSSPSPPLVKVKDEPVDEEYEQALISSSSTASVKDEPNTAKVGRTSFHKDFSKVSNMHITYVMVLTPFKEKRAVVNI